MFFNNSPKVWPMTEKHLDDVLTIIAEHDEDDAEAALSSYRDLGYDNQFVLTQGRQVLGVSGYRAAAHAAGCYWLSWSYINPEHQGQGHGVYLIKGVINRCYQQKARKIFVSASDYKDEQGLAIYERAHRFYKNMGFEHELTLPDYYAKGEAKIISSIDFEQEPEEVQPSWSASCGFLCVDSYEMLESDDVFTFAWDLSDSGSSSTVEQINDIVALARQKEAERIYVGLPSDAEEILRNLDIAGFKHMGELKDYYLKGVAEANLRLEL